MRRRPTLVCLNNSSEPPRLTRYIPKPIVGGFFSETFEIVDRDACDQALNTETMENFRLGKMRDQETPAELVNQPECA